MQETFDDVVALARRPLGFTHPRLETRVVEFDAIEAALQGQTAKVAICCLGTTIAQAGSRQNFRRVDYDYVLGFARAARVAGVDHFLVVSSVGASPNALTFYSRVKGEMESALAEVGFAALTIARPSLLLGDRDKSRLGEKLAAPFAKWLPSSIRGIEGETVARALARLAIESSGGVRIVPSGELQALGRSR